MALLSNDLPVLLGDTGYQDFLATSILSAVSFVLGSKGGGVGVGVGVGVGAVGGVNTFQQQYLGYGAGPVGEAPYSLQGLLPRAAPPTNSYYSPYQPPAAAAPSFPLQFTQQPQSGAFGSQFLSSQLQVAAAVQQMQVCDSVVFFTAMRDERKRRTTRFTVFKFVRL